MKKQEKELLFELTRFQDATPEKLRKLLTEGATPETLGYLFYNRVAGIAYDTLRKNGLLNHVNREYRNALQNTYLQNTLWKEDYLAYLRVVNQTLERAKIPYALLKGAKLCCVYPNGYRTSNDIDVLLAPDDLTTAADTLHECGFKQGHVRNNHFIEATRQEIIESRVMRGETIPFVYELDLPFLRFLEVDINFSLDYKNSAAAPIEKLLQRTIDFTISRYVSIRTLCEEDFFLHLCAHLYKEATTYPWVQSGRDLTLYKFCDIYMYLSQYNKAETDVVFKRAKELNLTDICCCAILWTNELLPSRNDYAITLARQYLVGSEHKLHEVVFPAQKKTLTYTKTNLRERFFAPNRCKLLREVPS